MAALQLPEFVVDLNSAEENIKNLFQIVKPEWNRDKIVVKTMSGGFSCLTSCVHLEENPDDAFTVRVRKLFEKIDNSHLADPKFEVELVQYLSTIDLFPTVHAVFQNGYCYQYIRGKPIMELSKDITETPEPDRKAVKKMIEALAKIHTIKIETKDYSQTDFFSRLSNLLENNYNADVPGFVDKEILQKEFEEILGYTKQFDLKITLVHGDTHPGNVVQDEETGKVTFVDWELAHIGYHIYDVAYCLQIIHFIEIMLIPGAPGLPDNTTIEESKKEILKWYFDKWTELNSLENDEETFEEFRRKVDLFGLVWCLTFIIMIGSCAPLLDADHMKEFPADMRMMLVNVYDHYCKIKDQRLKDLKLK